MKDNICIGCGDEFPRTFKKQLSCNRQCWLKYKRANSVLKERGCPGCGDAFRPIKREQINCTPECERKHRSNVPNTKEEFEGLYYSLSLDELSKRWGVSKSSVYRNATLFGLTNKRKVKRNALNIDEIQKDLMSMKIIDVAKKNSYSDVTMLKIIEKHGLKTLPLGHWAKKKKVPALSRKLIGEEKECVKCHNSFDLSNFLVEHGCRRGICRTCYQKQDRKRMNASIDLIFKRRISALRSHRLTMDTLTWKEYQVIFERQAGKCFYTGVNMEYQVGLGNNRTDTMSLDQVVSGGGYGRDNIVLCTRRANAIKTNASIKQMKEWLSPWYKLLLSEFGKFISAKSLVDVENSFSYTTHRGNTYKDSWKNSMKGDVDKIFTTHVKGMRSKAKLKGLPFNLNAQHELSRFKESAMKCFYTGVELDWDVSNNQKQNKLSVDKIIPELGYVTGNVVYCSRLSNYIKRDMTLDEMSKWTPGWHKLLVDGEYI